MTDLAVAYCYSGRSEMVVALVGIVIVELIKKGKKPHIEGMAVVAESLLGVPWWCQPCHCDYDIYGDGGQFLFIMHSL